MLMSSKRTLFMVLWPRLDDPEMSPNVGIVISSRHSFVSDICCGLGLLPREIVFGEAKVLCLRLVPSWILLAKKGSLTSFKHSLGIVICLLDDPNTSSYEGIVMSSKHSLVVISCLDLCPGLGLLLEKEAVFLLYEGIEMSSRHSFVAGPRLR